MNQTRLSEEELHAFVDDQLGASDRARILEILQLDPELQRRVAELRQAKELLRLAYAQPPQARTQARAHTPLGALQKIAAALLLALGIAGGWLLHGMWANTTLVQAKAPKGVVIQVSEADPVKWELALINARNARKNYRNAQVEIVAYGPGLKMMRKDSPVAATLLEANQNGVKLLACGNTMRLTKTKQDELSTLVDIVPAGVVAIVDRQTQGYAYVRP